jgi:peptidoglycan/xylan/chitin deacetylase (PgdA/CDA1 family)
MSRLLIVFLVLSLSLTAKGSKISLVIENLPSTDHMTLISAVDINDAIIGVLDKYKIPAVGFVNESRIYVDSNSANRVAILKKWLARGYELGNQTFSNKSFNLVADEEYFDDIVQGGRVLNSLLKEHNMKLRYFIPPYLHLGTNARAYNSLLNFLKARSYILVPVTMVNEDWLFNRDYVKAIEMQNLELAEKIKNRYIQFTNDRLAFYAEASRRIFRQDIDQVFLLHLNKLNEDTIDEIVKIPVKLGYRYVKLEEVLSSFPYNTPKYWSFAKSGSSWIKRFDDLDGKIVDWKKEPQAEGYLDDLFVSN